MPDTAEVVATVRENFGPEFVTARLAAEERTRAFLDEHAGTMDAERIIALGRLINEHGKLGRVRYDRFTPGFTGAIMSKLGSDPGTFNTMTTRLWREPVEDAVATLGGIYADRSTFPHAGSSLPSFLLYLRDPERFGICVNATMLGLAHETGAHYQAKSLSGYESFSADLRAWRHRHGVAPQEADAILTAIMRAAKPAAVAVEKLPLTVGIEGVAEGCFLGVEQVDQWVQALTTGMRQGVFHGPPGTGKTHVARLLARHLATSPDHIELTQFHPAYSYEDFIEGLRPETSGGGLRYEVRPGVFARLCDRAAKAPDETFVMIIDEMNRADLAAVFGELLYLLEYRGAEVTLPYSQRRLAVPSNVFLLGTMNTADRSLAMLDFALRRRFNAFPLPPDETVLARWTTGRPDGNAELALGVFRLIRDRVGPDAPVSPGHSYWMTEALDAAAAERIWEYQLRPYLAEYWFEQPAELSRLDTDVRSLIAELA
ncbi:AAA family ATPase [Actinoplanes sp. NPDC023714]|uniref:McrB family protein n=1 Tax=Actinoplanes sp. NPDC023714 TaxID=3154322 RepID=UPI0033E449FF